jgi:hypothetical protein
MLATEVTSRELFHRAPACSGLVRPGMIFHAQHERPDTHPQASHCVVACRHPQACLLMHLEKHQQHPSGHLGELSETIAKSHAWTHAQQYGKLWQELHLAAHYLCSTGLQT